MHTLKQVFFCFLFIVSLATCGESDSNTETMTEGGSEAGTEMMTEAGTEMMTEAGTETTSMTSPWNDPCVEDTDCSAPTDFCVKQPGMTEGYCTYACLNNARCTDLGAPSDWTCNTLNFAGCEDIPSNWCGPQSEITDFPGVIIECP